LGYGEDGYRPNLGLILELGEPYPNVVDSRTFVAILGWPHQINMNHIGGTLLILLNGSFSLILTTEMR
jgi:hypothetical protein